MKIAFFGLDKEKQPIFTSALRGIEISFFEEVLDKKSVEKSPDAEIVCVFVDCTVDREVIDKLPNLKFIATRSTGYDHVDVKYAGTKGISVSNVPAYGSHTVAEFTFGLLLNLSRKIASSNSYLRETLKYNYLPWMEGFDLAGKTLGVVGTGKIGKNVIKIAKGLEMNVIACDPHPDALFAAENKFEYKNFQEVISGADIITLHTPYTPENHHMINKESISTMKKGVYLVNTARGALIDTEALVTGLKEGIIAGVGIDVIEGEVETQAGEKGGVTSLNHELMKMPNVIVSPHMAFYTREAVDSIMRTTAENIKGFISGAPTNLVK